MAGLSVGARLGQYQVLAAIGAGGMGEVYRARDARLGRDVALKVLPNGFALDPDRLARFKREAQVLASLNHPNIAAIYGLEDADGIQALVLELVEGPTLADRIALGPIPAEDAFPIGRQIAEALEAAHDQGIVHRDLKPANIKLRPDGTVKVLDFGLAKAIDPADPISGSAIASPTITSPALTQMGMILGTAAYMSPEQVKGRAADKRSDVWAFGVVLYEMLSGQRAFKGDDVSDTLAAVLRQDIDLASLPASTPASVRTLIGRCLDRDAKRRLRDLGEARIVLDNPGPAASDMPAPVNARTPQSLWRRAMPVALAAALAAVVGIAAGWFAGRRPPTAPQVTRFLFQLPDGQSFGVGPRSLIALSPDGREIVYATQGGLFRRAMSAMEANAIRGTERFEMVTDPVFAPDGRSLLFYARSDRTIKRIAIGGGTAVTVCRAEAPFGISWTTDGVVFGQGRQGIMRVSAEGGTPDRLVAAGENEELQGPQLLPGGRHLLYTRATGTDIDRWSRARVVVQALPAGPATTLVDGATDGRYLSSGHLVYGADGALFAVPFDAARLVLTGPRESMIEGVRPSGGRVTGGMQFSISESGSLIYLPGPDISSRTLWEMIVSDRQGTIERLKLPPSRFGPMRAAPDGKQIAFSIDDGKEEMLYTYDLSGSSTMQRAPFGGNSRFPVWSADSKRIAFQSDREGDRAIWLATLGSGVERLTKPAAGEAHVPEAWSPKEEILLFTITKGSDTSLWSFSVRDRKAAPFGDVHSLYPTGARFHPSGRWVAYTIRDSEVSKAYVEPFPATGSKYELFVKGYVPNPHKVAWSVDGNELFYVPRFGEFESVPVTFQPTFAFGQAVTVPRQFNPGGPNNVGQFDLMPNGKFVGVIPSGQPSGIARLPQTIQVVLNWSEELRARVPSPR